MQLHEYQITAMRQIEVWLDALMEAKRNNVIKDYPSLAWKMLEENNRLPVSISGDGLPQTPAYKTRTSASGEPVPHACMRIPTGGGKTILGVSALGKLSPKNGLVVWIVPSKAIYEQTLNAFENAEHPYRKLLNFISGSDVNVKILKKGDRFTADDIHDYLCIMVLMLASFNKKRDGGEDDFLKIFRDSDYPSFFPEHKDEEGNKKLIQTYVDLERGGKNKEWVKHSLGNILKMCRPVVILDEAHQAYGINKQANKDYADAINQFNPSYVLELSATPNPDISNILVDVSGTTLRDTQMIKQSIELHTQQNSDWKVVIDRAQEKLKELERDASLLMKRDGKYIRPIVLVRTERTDKEDPRYVHAEDVRAYLTKTLKVLDECVKIQSSKRRELKDEDLLSESSQVNWIITKNALKEGWDCSFAYILVVLDNPDEKNISEKSGGVPNIEMTQMTGRILRQPYGELIQGFDSLNNCYIYCYNRKVDDVVKQIKANLEKEGFGEIGNFVREDKMPDKKRSVRVSKRKSLSQKLDVFLPQVLHRDGDKWRLVDYERDILSAIPWSEVDANALQLNGQDDSIEETVSSIQYDGKTTRLEKRDLNPHVELNMCDFSRYLIDAIPNPWLAAKVSQHFVKKQLEGNMGELLRNRVYFISEIRKFIEKNIDSLAEKVFRDKITNGIIKFHLKLDSELNYELNKSIEAIVVSDERNKILKHRNGEDLSRSLFEPVFEAEFNCLEQNFALYLDKSNAIHWWHRMVSKQGYALQGWRRHRIYPDFIACKEGDDRLLILETKGRHLKGNEDSEYKMKLLETLEGAYKNSLEAGEVEVPGSPCLVFRMLFETEWEKDIESIVKPKK